MKKSNIFQKLLQIGKKTPQPVEKKTPQLVFPAYTITVNYDYSVERLVKEGKYDFKHPSINSERFPSSETGIAQVDIFLINFLHGGDSIDAIRSGFHGFTRVEAIEEIISMGYRPASLKELLALGIAYPELQRNNTIIALTSYVRIIPNFPVEGSIPSQLVFLGRRNSKRQLGMESQLEGSKLPLVWSFAAVKK